MCCNDKKCQKPKALKGKPGKCSPEQVKKCHGSSKTHACAGAKKKKVK